MTAISLIVCTRNRGAQLPRALDSLAALATTRSWELVVVDNGSSDDTPAILAEFEGGFRGRLTLLREPRPGLSRARNAGWGQAAGEVVAFTDDDCYPAPDFLDAVCACFQETLGLGFLGGKVGLFDPADARMTIQELNRAVFIEPRTLLPLGLIHGANLSVRREALEAVGGFDTCLGAGARFCAGEDSDVQARLLARGWRGLYDPRAVVYHHHGRRDPKAIAATMASYDRGRGAYYAKSLVQDRHLRAALLWQWLIVGAVKAPRRTLKELLAALEYLGARRWQDCERRTVRAVA